LEHKTFAELGLSPKVQAAVEAAGYTTPTPIQEAAIPVAVTGRDVLGIAQTGTGKTASFVLPMICRLETGRARARMPRSLILAPTRELAAQVAQSFEKYGVNHKLSLALLIGGVSMDDQVKKLDRGVDVLIATPGRLLDHFQRGRVMLMGVEILVIDEADRMLDMGFIPDIEKICKLLPPRRQTLFFSATMPPEITRLVSQFLKDPERIEVAPPATTAKTITQRFQFCPNGEDWAKREMLRQLIASQNVKNAIIFCNRKVEVAILHKSLVKHGFNAGALHGDMDQKARTETLDKFRAGELMLLAASDVAARGLDIPDVSHIFNFDLPWQPDDYVHRIGRTGRAGKEGASMSLVTTDELKSLKDIEKMLGEPVVWIGEGPSEEDYAEGGRKRRGRGGRGAPQRGRGGARGPASSARGGDKGRREEHRPHARPAEQRAEGRPERAAEPRRQEPRRQEAPRQEAPRHEAPRQEAPRQEANGQRSPRQEPHRQEGPRQQAPREASQDQRPPRQEARRQEGRRHEPRAAEKPQQQRHAEGGNGHAAHHGQPRAERQRQQPQRSRGEGQQQPARAGFADNIPAFLRNPVKRPAKVASE
jgi:superfamily II DNA/RNA helicase